MGHILLIVALLAKLAKICTCQNTLQYIPLVFGGCGGEALIPFSLEHAPEAIPVFIHTTAIIASGEARIA